MSGGFRRHEGIAAPFLADNVNTDLIIPSREMRRVSKLGLGEALFANLRYRDGARQPDPDFVLNRPAYAGASLLLAGANFGCGSSREHAVWALKDFGIRVVIAESFAGIFESNCIANGLLPLALPSAEIARLAEWCAGDPQARPLAVDLEAQQLTAGTRTLAFEIAPAARQALLSGVSPIDRILSEEGETIRDFMARDCRRRPWLYREGEAAG